MLCIAGTLGVWSRRLVGWVGGKSVGFDWPCFADIFEGCEALDGLQPPRIIICIEKVVKGGGQLRVTVVMVLLDGGLLDRPVHSLDFAVGR